MSSRASFSGTARPRPRPAPHRHTYTPTFYPGVTGGTTAASLTTVDPASIAAAKNYNAVIAVAGTDSSTGTEGVDRSTLALPGAPTSRTPAGRRAPRSPSST